MFTLAKIPGLGTLHFIKWLLPLSEAYIYLHCHWRAGEIWTIPVMASIAPVDAMEQMLSNWQLETQDEDHG